MFSYGATKLPISVTIISIVIQEIEENKNKKATIKEIINMYLAMINNKKLKEVQLYFIT